MDGAARFQPSTHGSLVQGYEQSQFSTNGLAELMDVLERSDSERLHRAPQKRHWTPLDAMTLQLAALFWLSVLIVSSVLWGLAGTDPVESAVGKLMLNSVGAALSIVIAMALRPFRQRGLLVKAPMASALSLIAGPIYSFADFEIYKWCVSPTVVAFDIQIFSTTVISGTAIFFGWSCLYVALGYAFDMRDRERALAAAREEALAAQMRALRYQVNPHFLFNTLNSIAGLIEEGAADRAGRMVISLSTFLRTTLALDPMHDVPLSEALILQEDYLEIERERFSDRLHYNFDVPDDVRGALVPSLILQPLVENAVKHGVGRSDAPIGIQIAARREGERLIITVENDLKPIDSRAPFPGIGIGLRNVAGRLRARFGAHGSLAAQTQGDGCFRVELRQPWRTG